MACDTRPVGRPLRGRSGNLHTDIRIRSSVFTTVEKLLNWNFAEENLAYAETLTNAS